MKATHQQMSLFGELDIPKEEKEEPRGDKNFGEKYAFLFTATEKGNSTDVHFMMTIEDAQKWCSLPISKGVLHGTRWAYFYTSVENFFNCHWGGHAADTLADWHDNGKWDEKIKEAGLTKFGWAKSFKMLLDAGYINHKNKRQ